MGQLVGAPLSVALGPEVGRVTSACGTRAQHALVVDRVPLAWGATQRIGAYWVTHGGATVGLGDSDACDGSPDEVRLAIIAVDERWP